MDSEILRLQELTAKTSDMEYTILRLQELKQDVDWEAVAADQALTIALMKQREWVGLTAVEAMKQALAALNTTDTHPISSAEQYYKEMRAMEALEDAIADADEIKYACANEDKLKDKNHA
jgi:hypothetical protein